MSPRRNSRAPQEYLRINERRATPITQPPPKESPETPYVFREQAFTRLVFSRIYQIQERVGEAVPLPRSQQHLIRRSDPALLLANIVAKNSLDEAVEKLSAIDPSVCRDVTFGATLLNAVKEQLSDRLNTKLQVPRSRLTAIHTKDAQTQIAAQLSDESIMETRLACNAMSRICGHDIALPAVDHYLPIASMPTQLYEDHAEGLGFVNGYYVGNLDFGVIRFRSVEQERAS